MAEDLTLPPVRVVAYLVHSAEPPADLWQHLSSQLQQGQPPLSIEKHELASLIAAPLPDEPPGIIVCWCGDALTLQTVEALRQLRQLPPYVAVPFQALAAEASSAETRQQLETIGIVTTALDHVDAPTLLARIQGAAGQGQSLLSSRQADANRIHELEQAYNDLYERNRTVEKELFTTRQLQQSLLPVPLEAEEPGVSMVGVYVDKPMLRVSGVYLPCDALGGDMFDLIDFGPDGGVGLTVADVSGHGVPAAFVTAIFKASYHRLHHQHREPGTLMAAINEELHELIKTGHYITGVSCLIKGRTLAYSNAGHPYPMLYRAASNSIERLSESSVALAWFGQMPYDTAEVTLEQGDALLLFSDGVPEMQNSGGTLFSEERLEALLGKAVESTGGGPAAIEAILYALSDFTEGEPLQDDLTMVLIEAR